jgi:hypothetical protein
VLRDKETANKTPWYDNSPFVLDVSYDSIMKNCHPRSGLTWDQERKTISDDELLMLTRSMQQRGQLFPVTIEIPSMTVLDGHRRILATPYLLVKVRFVHLKGFDKCL